MAEKLPWFPFYGYLFFDDEAVKLMDDAGVGRYLRLLWHQWIHGSVPTAAAALARLLRVEPSAVEGVLLPVFPTSADGRRRNPKLEEIRAEQEAAREGRRRAGSPRGETCSAVARPAPLPAQPETQPTLSRTRCLRLTPRASLRLMSAHSSAAIPAAHRLRAFESLSSSQSLSPAEGGAGGKIPARPGSSRRSKSLAPRTRASGRTRTSAPRATYTRFGRTSPRRRSPTGSPPAFRST